MSSKDVNENDSDNENENENEKEKTLITIKQLNDAWDGIIDKSKSFAEQRKSIRKVENLEEHYYIDDYDEKELKFEIFKLRAARLSNEIDEKLFEQIFGHKFETLANKLINTTNKEENQIIVNNISENKQKLYKEYKIRDSSYDVILPSYLHDNHIEAIDLILNFNKKFN